MATSLSTAEMKALIRRHFEDFVNLQKAEVIRQNMTADFCDHDGPGGKPTGVEGDETMMRAMYSLFPDLRITIHEMIAEGEKVMCRNRWEGTNTKTGRRMEFHGFVEWRFEGDKIAERWATVSAPSELEAGG
jgi:predicted ester cyclase